jgi:hypothetical protein
MLEEEQRLFEAAARKLQGVTTPPPMSAEGQSASVSSQLMVLNERDASTYLLCF